MAQQIFATAGKIIHLGRTGENLATEVIFDITELKKAYQNDPNIVFELIVSHPGAGVTYIAETKTVSKTFITLDKNGKEKELNKHYLTWRVRRSDLRAEFVGLGQCEIRCQGSSINLDQSEENSEEVLPEQAQVFMLRAGESNEYLTEKDIQFLRAEDDTINSAIWIDTKTGAKDDDDDDNNGDSSIEDQTVAKSVIYDILITKSLSETDEEVPAAAQGWVDQVLNAGQDARTYMLYSRSWAVGKPDEHTVEIREGEDTNNAKYYAEEAGKAQKEVTELYEKVIVSEDVAAEAAKIASQSQEAAETAKTDAQTARGKAEEAQGAAEAAQSETEEFKKTAVQSATDAQTAQGKAEAAQEAAETAQDAAEAAQEAAENAQAATEKIAIHPPRIGLKEEGEDPDYWYIWKNEGEGYYDKTASKVRFSIVAVYKTEEEMKADTTKEVGDFVIVSSPLDNNLAKLWVNNGADWTYVTDLTGYEGIGIATIKYMGNNQGDVVGTTPNQPGAIDTYRITYTDEKTQDYQVYNGKDGEGKGDMLASSYDPNNVVAGAGGIEEYIKNTATKITYKSWTAADAT